MAKGHQLPQLSQEPCGAGESTGVRHSFALPTAYPYSPQHPWGAQSPTGVTSDHSQE